MIEIIMMERIKRTSPKNLYLEKIYRKDISEPMAKDSTMNLDRLNEALE